MPSEKDHEHLRSGCTPGASLQIAKFQIKNKLMIDTERLVLRPWTLDDATALYKYASDCRVSELALWPAHTSVEMSREVIERFFLPNPHTLAITLKETGEPIGCIGLVPEGDEHYETEPSEREVGYWTGYPYWNRGIISEALEALTGYCRETMELSSLLITTDKRNVASQRVAEKCGFVFVEEYAYDNIVSCAYRLKLH